ncbi:glycosyltransferase family protein [Spongiimicrobium salis]|uniref:hypothetical protein n=1 Tax=Spongiimicrobium salis TaxID=1667022 RepID=UPI00374D0921
MNNTKAVPKEEQMKNALTHYEKAGASINEWRSDIPVAIEQFYKKPKEWILPKEKTPERVQEYWCPEDTAQEVLVQFFRAKRYKICVGWFEGGKWWCNDEVIEYPVIAWKYLPKQYQPEIDWDFVMWNEKSLNDAQLIGVDENGVHYLGSGTWVDGELLYEPRDVEMMSEDDAKLIDG